VSAPDVRARLARLLRPARATPEVSGPILPVRDRLRARAARLRSGEPALPAGLEREERSGVLARRCVLDLGHRHGIWKLEEALVDDEGALALLAKDPALAGLGLSDAIFLDTETSGLSGGAGTWVFLVGLGCFRVSATGRAGFEVWQGFLAEPAEERELLAEAADRIRGAPLVVSFFGKSFDRYRLEDKMRIHGIASPFAGRPHLDLYHPLRRLYGSGMPDGKLKTLERALCGVEREDDLPCSRAPAAWFDFLHGRAHELEGVFRHNRDDVLSLVTLGAHLGRTLAETRRDGSPLSGSAADRARGVALAGVHAGNRAEALVWFERSLERGAGPFTAGQERAYQSVRRAERRNFRRRSDPALE
jgi:uncharacterized protein YprB with RNaseH-like and TPR domain